MNEPTMEILARRLDRVERENRVLKRAGVVALAVIAAVVLMGQATESKVEKVVEAERFVVRDSSGNLRAALDESGLSLFDKEKTRVRLGVEADGIARLVIRGEGEKSNITMGTTTEGVVLSLIKGKQEVILGLGPDNEASLGLTDINRNPRVGLTVLAGGETSLDFWDNNGKKRAALGYSSDGVVALAFFDKDEKLRSTMATFHDGTPTILLLDKNKKVIWSVPTQEVTGTSRLWVLWVVALSGQQTIAGRTWPTQSQCEQDKAARLSKMGEQSSVTIVCLPEGVNPRGGR